MAEREHFFTIVLENDEFWSWDHDRGEAELELKNVKGGKLLDLVPVETGEYVLSADEFELVKKLVCAGYDVAEAEDDGPLVRAAEAALDLPREFLEECGVEFDDG